MNLGIWVLLLFIALTSAQTLEYVKYHGITWGENDIYTMATMDAGGNIAALKHTSSAGSTEFKILLTESKPFAYTNFGCTNGDGDLSYFGLLILNALLSNDSLVYSMLPLANSLYIIRHDHILCAAIYSPLHEDNECIRLCGSSDLSQCNENKTNGNVLIYNLAHIAESISVGLTYGAETTRLSITPYGKPEKAITHVFTYGQLISGPFLCAASYGYATWWIQSLAVKNISYTCRDFDAHETCIAPSLYVCTDRQVRATCYQKYKCIHGTYNYTTTVCDCDHGYTGTTCDQIQCVAQCLNGNCTSYNHCDCHVQDLSGVVCENLNVVAGNKLTVYNDLRFTAQSTITFNGTLTSTNISFVDIYGKLSLESPTLTGQLELLSTEINKTVTLTIFRSAKITNCMAHCRTEFHSSNTTAACWASSYGCDSVGRNAYLLFDYICLPLTLPPSVIVGSSIYIVIIWLITILLIKKSANYRKFIVTDSTT
jgi:hypothetical protein